MPKRCRESEAAALKTFRTMLSAREKTQYRLVRRLDETGAEGKAPDEEWEEEGTERRVVVEHTALVPSGGQEAERRRKGWEAFLGKVLADVHPVPTTGRVLCFYYPLQSNPPSKKRRQEIEAVLLDEVRTLPDAHGPFVKSAVPALLPIGFDYHVESGAEPSLHLWPVVLGFWTQAAVYDFLAQAVLEAAKKFQRYSHHRRILLLDCVGATGAIGRGELGGPLRDLLCWMPEGDEIQRRVGELWVIRRGTIRARHGYPVVIDIEWRSPQQRGQSAS